MRFQGTIVNRIYRCFEPLNHKLDYLLLLCLCLAIRIYHINTVDLWGDELHHFFHLHNLTKINEMLLNVRKTAIYAFVNIFYKSIIPTGTQYAFNFVPRFPALVFGTLSVVILYDAFKRYIEKSAAYILGIFACASYPLIIYAIRSRVYSMTHFFVSIYIWLYVSMINKMDARKLVLFLLFSLLGFFTYPYLVFSIYIFYFCIGLLVFIKGTGHKLLFISTFSVFFMISITFLIVTRSSFSHPVYSTIPLSSSFFIYAIKGMLSYYSGNSYILVGLTFIMPLINVYLSIKRRVEINYIYLLWAICSSLLILHVLIVTHTKNAFNPRHITHLAIPFIVCASYGIYEIHKKLSRFIDNRKLFQYYRISFGIVVCFFAFANRDFRYYLKTGINYHGGSNIYSARIKFINGLFDRFGKDDMIIVSPKNMENYPFYHYRTDRRVIYADALEKKIGLLNNSPDSIHIGFIFDGKLTPKVLPDSLQKDYLFFENKRMIVLISQDKISKEQINEHINDFYKKLSL